MAKKGSGSLYHPLFPPPGMSYQDAKAAGVLVTSPGFWMQYYKDGKKYRENCHTAREQEARRLLNSRLGVVATGAPFLPKASKVSYEQGKADLVAHYEVSGERNLEEAGWRFKHLDVFFQGRLLQSIGPDDSTKYAKARKAEGASSGTVNRELGVLGRLLSLAYENDKLLRLPKLRKLEEAKARQGFFEVEKYQAVMQHLSPPLQAACAVMYTLGWRLQEVLKLQRHQLDLRAGTLTLATSKNGEGRVVYLPEDLKARLAAQVDRIKAMERKLGKIIPHLFVHEVGAQQQSVGLRHVAVVGEPIRNFRRAWATACKKAGCPTMLRHDFRRTGTRNLVRSGVPERVCMEITGHKTRSVFERYNIVSDGDLKEAARKLSAHAAK